MKAIAPALLALAALAVASCSQAIRPSDESRILEETLVPRVLQWANGSNESFSLSEFSRARGYDLVCLVREYQMLNSVEKRAGMAVDTYYSTFGDRVPEGQVALLARKGGSAHAALVYSRTVGFDFPSDPMCVLAVKAKLIRVPDPARSATIVRLEEEKPAEKL
jgi:hypothetical protein